MCYSAHVKSLKSTVATAYLLGTPTTTAVLPRNSQQSPTEQPVVAVVLFYTAHHIKTVEPFVVYNGKVMSVRASKTFLQDCLVHDIDDNFVDERSCL